MKADQQLQPDPWATIRLIPNERRVAENRRDCYWLCGIQTCAAAQILAESVSVSWRLPCVQQGNQRQAILDARRSVTAAGIRNDGGCSFSRVEAGI